MGWWGGGSGKGDSFVARPFFRGWLLLASDAIDRYFLLFISWLSRMKPLIFVFDPSVEV